MLFKTFIRKQLRLKAHTVTEIEPSDEQMVVQIERSLLHLGRYVPD